MEDGMAQNLQSGCETGTASEVVTLPRVGKPPLRLKARPVARLACPTTAGGSLELALWARPSGGVALQFSLPGQTAGGLDAVILPDTAAAFDELEKICRSVARRPRQTRWRKTATGREAVDRLDADFADAVDARNFLLLASEALERWAEPAPGEQR